jgi:Hypoxia induced protein conserved region.
MSTALYILIPLAVAITAIIVAVGIVSFFSGGKFHANWSNRLMRMRIIAQAVAIVLILALVWINGTPPSF